MGKRWILLIVFGVGLFCIYSFDRIYCEQETERYAWVFDRFNERLERNLQEDIEQSLNSVENLQAFMLAGEALPDEQAFVRFAASSLTHYPEIMDMAYSDENNIVRYVYAVKPAVTEEGADLAAIGKYPYFLTAAGKARQEQTVTINRMPVRSLQGEAVFGLRAPLFHGNQFRGMVWTSFAPEKTIREALAKVDPSIASNAGNYYIEISTKDGGLLYEFNQLAPDSPVGNFIVAVADTEWLVKTGWSRPPRPSIYIRGLIWGLGSSVLILLLLLHNTMLRRQTWLTQAVAEKTRELLLKNKQLEIAVFQHEQTGQALLKSEQRLAALLAAVPDKLLRVSREGVILDIEVKNPGELYRPRDKMLNKNITDVLPDAVCQRLIETGEKVLATGEPATVEYQLAVNGAKRDYESRMAVSQKDEILVIVRDVTEQKQDEACERLLTEISARVLAEASMESILRYTCEQLVATFPITLVRVILTEDGDNVKISVAAGKLAVKRQDSDLNSKEKDSLSSAAIQKGILQVVQRRNKLSPWQEKLIDELQVDRTEIQAEIAMPIVLKDRTVGAFYLISSKPDYWDERIIARLRRFSDQMTMAISAASDRQRLRLLIAGLEAAANAIVITGRDGSIEWINPAFSSQTGYTEQEALGQNLLVLSGYQDESFRQHFWQQLNARTEAWRGEFAHYRKNGSFYDEVMTITPVCNSCGEIINFIAIKEDITEQKLAAAAMVKANEIRTQAEKLSSLGTMAAGLSHEINQPLNSIKMLASGMVYAYHNGKERPVADIMRNVEEISHQADRINSIIMHLRSFIRRGNAQFTYCDVNQAVKNSLEIIGSQLTVNKIQVQLELADTRLLVYAVPTALEGLVVNLVCNAIQSMEFVPYQRKQLIIRTWANTNTIYLRIADKGPGILDDHKTKVFEPFFSTKPGGDNLGLGLFIVQSIVASCQGTIELVSGENEGAVFLISFPVAREEFV
ncbi:PAS domain S-box protein [Sporomusa aerivorans]|uniref:PAS domain S-box protein n=1 Tax=Sporomusa aerivorans TaxID=204936 RepID=UPI00352AC329